MRFEYDKRGTPVLVLEKGEATVKITFTEKPHNPRLKDTILEMLAAAYENSLVSRPQKVKN